MIVFYTPSKPIIELTQTTVCDNVCSAKCITPKSKCCNQYKKKGINCKRCPNILLKVAS